MDTKAPWTKKLTIIEIQRLLEMANRGMSTRDIAATLHISPQSVSYRLRKHKFYETLPVLNTPPGKTLHLTGTFWLYYRTRAGNPKTQRNKDKRPWVVRQVPKSHGLQLLDVPQDNIRSWPEGKEILAWKVRVIHGSAATYYNPNPVWTSRHGEHIRWVRGFLIVEGVIQVET